MGVNAFAYVGPYLVLPKQEIEVVIGTYTECSHCQSTGKTHDRFCARCGGQMVLARKIGKRIARLLDIIATVEDPDMHDEMYDTFYQPEGVQEIISNLGSFSRTLDNFDTHEIDVTAIPDILAKYREQCAPILKWFSDNGLPAPEIKYGVVAYYA